MKQFQILMLISFAYYSSYGQNDFRIDYCTLQNGNFGEYTLFTTDDFSTWVPKKESPHLTSNPSFNNQFYFIKDKKRNMIFYQDNILNKLVSIPDTLNKMCWAITHHKKTILGFSCIKAKTSFRGRDYIAFFTEDITVKDGPWKFGGLPGLILEIKSEDGYLNYQAYNIGRVKSNNFKMIEIQTISFLDWDQFKTMFTSVYDHYINLIEINEAVNPNSRVKLKVETTEIIYPKIQLGEGYTIHIN